MLISITWLFLFSEEWIKKPKSVEPKPIVQPKPIVKPKPNEDNKEAEKKKN